MVTLQSDPKNARFAAPVSPWGRYWIATAFNAFAAGYAFIKDRLGRWVHHTGLDINRGSGNQDKGDPVYATAPGVVRWVGFQRRGFGNFVVIQHENGGITVWGERHAHLDTVLVKIGDRVAAGQQIGTLGNSGDPSGEMRAHLHLDYFLVDPITLPGGYADWPGSDEKRLLRSYIDPLQVWKKWGLTDPKGFEA
jgi:murein DD-endopeptidase MepM/ murein hydrolase activator NlpD